MTTLLSEPDTRADLLAAVDALTVGTRTKVIHHSDDGVALCTDGCPATAHTHTSVVEHDSLLAQLEAAILGEMSTLNGSASSLAHTRGVLDSTALYLCTRIASQIADWARMAGAPHRGAPAETLRAWYVVWAAGEQEPGADRAKASMLNGWAGQIASTLDPEETIQRKEPCPNPECVQGVDPLTGRATWWDRNSREQRLFPLILTYRPGATDPDDAQGELSPSVQASIEAATARCRACGTEWTARALAWELEQAAESTNQQDGTMR